MKIKINNAQNVESWNILNYPNSFNYPILLILTTRYVNFIRPLTSYHHPMALMINVFD